MEQKLYIVRAIKDNGDVKETRYTNEENLKRAIFYTRHDTGCKVSVNEASMCFDGYLVNGGYRHDLSTLEIKEADL